MNYKKGDKFSLGKKIYPGYTDTVLAWVTRLDAGEKGLFLLFSLLVIPAALYVIVLCVAVLGDLVMSQYED